MTEKHVLKNGREVAIRELKQNEDVFELCDFVNETRRDSRYLSAVEMVTPEEETKWLEKRLKEISEKKAVFFVAENNGKIVGAASAEAKEGPNAHTAEFGVMLRKEWRGVGLGKLLTEKTIDKAKKNEKFEIIYLKAFTNNKNAIKLYEEMGFRTIAKLPNFYKRESEYCDQLYMVLKK